MIALVRKVSGQGHLTLVESFWLYSPNPESGVIAASHAISFIRPKCTSLVGNRIAKASLHTLRTSFALSGKSTLAWILGNW